MIGYLDTSVLLRIILDETRKRVSLESFERLLASDLVRVECLRRIGNLRLSGEINDDEVIRIRESLFEVLPELDLIRLSKTVLARATDAFPLPIGTLDGLHLSSALIWKERTETDLVMLTHDLQLGKAARAIGIPVVGDSGEYR